jgi:hypothetical protein
MNAIAERWVKTLRTELPDRTLVWIEAHRYAQVSRVQVGHFSFREARSFFPVTAPELTHPLFRMLWAASAIVTTIP